MAIAACADNPTEVPEMEVLVSHRRHFHRREGCSPTVLELHVDLAATFRARHPDGFIVCAPTPAHDTWNAELLRMHAIGNAEIAIRSIG